MKQNTIIIFFLRLGVSTFTSLRGFEAICSKLGRAVRYNLCCASLHKGFPLPSLTQNKCVFITIIIAFTLLLFYFPVSSPSPLERAGVRTKKEPQLKKLGFQRKATTYSPTNCSTICAGGLNFSVRDGKR